MDVERVAAAAKGQWTEILSALGVSEFILNGKNQPCPSCEGVDRFQYTNYQNDGMYVCRGCGNGNGFNLLMLVNGWGFKGALEKVANFIGLVDAGGIKPKKINRLDYILTSMEKLDGNDAVSKYLKSRKIYSKSLSENDIGISKTEKYFDENGFCVGTFSAMVSIVRDNLGEIITCQLTYLNENGTKANVKAPKKLISSPSGNGCGVYPFGFNVMRRSEIGITEGIEDAISATKMFNVPVVAAIGTAGIENFRPNEKAQYLTAFIQNDSGFQGQAASFKMLKSIAKNENIKLDWILSKRADFNDDLLSLQYCSVANRKDEIDFKLGE